MPSDSLVQRLVHEVPHMLSTIVRASNTRVPKVVDRAVQHVGPERLETQALSVHGRGKHHVSQARMLQPVLQASLLPLLPDRAVGIMFN
jgi:hypothetical protein